MWVVGYIVVFTLFAVSMSGCREEKSKKENRQPLNPSKQKTGDESGKDFPFHDKEVEVQPESKIEEETNTTVEKKIQLPDSTVEVAIPSGHYPFGSKTGEPFRDPSKEIDEIEVEIHKFYMDRYPYPNEKGASPLTGITFEEAKSACEREGKRLCTELEWEIACRGKSGKQFPQDGVSDFGIERLGEIFEWTSSEWMEPELPRPRGIVVKGNSPLIHFSAMRCSGRTFRQPEKSYHNVGFRCCKGRENKIKIQLEPLKKPFEEVENFPLDKFQLLVKTTPQMKKVSEDPKPFGEDALRYVLLRRNIDLRDSYPGYIFTTKPVWWRPMRGEELLVLSGYCGRNSFALALYYLGEGKFKHAASVILLDSEFATVKLPIPIILVAGIDRAVINWAPCWNCSEGGSFYIDNSSVNKRADFLIHTSYRWGP